MLTFQLLSDIHLEFGLCKSFKPIADYLILAGDIGYPEHDNFKIFLTEKSKLFNKIFYVAGNHEYYQNWKKGKNKHIDTIEETNVKIKEIIKESGDNIYFLNNDYHDLTPGLRIVGSTLWSHIKKNTPGISDSLQIYSEPNLLVTDDFLRTTHMANVEFIKNQIQEATEKNIKLIMITHHLPSEQLVLEKYNIEYPTYVSHFASNLDYLIKDPIKVWCAGHSHGFNYKKINNVDCWVNAYGYPKEDRNGAKLEFSFTLDLDNTKK